MGLPPRYVVPAPLPSAPSTKKPFRLTLLHNNDGESKYVVGDSIANYGGITRFKTVLDGLRKDADATDVPSNTDKGTVFISSGDNYLNEAPMLRSAEQVTGPWRYERVEDASHWMQLDQPERVNALLVDFLR